MECMWHFDRTSGSCMFIKLFCKTCSARYINGIHHDRTSIRKEHPVLLPNYAHGILYKHKLHFPTQIFSSITSGNDSLHIQSLYFTNPSPLAKDTPPWDQLTCSSWWTWGMLVAIALTMDPILDPPSLPHQSHHNLLTESKFNPQHPEPPTANPPPKPKTHPPKSHQYGHLPSDLRSSATTMLRLANLQLLPKLPQIRALRSLHSRTQGSRNQTSRTKSK